MSANTVMGPDMRNNQMSVGVASDFNEVMQAIAIRSAVYVGEKGWPFHEEWDGNDFSATHLLARVDGDAAGTLRIRYFGGFAKVERLAVLPRFRQKRYGRMGVAYELGEYAIDFLQQKGINRFYGHALAELTPFWNKIFRGRAVQVAEGFECDGKDVIAMAAEFDPVPGAIAIDSDPYVIVRREGHWERPGYWEGGEAVPSLQPKFKEM